MKNKSTACDKEQFVASKLTRRSAVLKSDVDLTLHLYDKPTTYHSHENYYEIFVVTAGQLNHHIDGKTQRMQAGDAYFLKPGEYHCHSAYKNEPSTHVNITCYPEIAKSIFQYYGKETAPTFEDQHVWLDSNKLNTLNSLVNLVLNAGDDAHTNLLIKSIFSFLVGLFYTQTKEEETRPDWLRDFIQRLDEVKLEDISLADVYRLSNRSQSSLTTQFKKHMGKTIIQYLTDLKLNYACNLLEKTDFSTVTISLMIGFSSLSHFNHIFKQKFGVPPSAYRAMKQEQKNEL